MTVAVERTDRVASSGADPRVEMMMDDLDISRAEAERRLDAQVEQTELADRLRQQLGSAWAGSLIDRDTGQLVIYVTSARAAKEVAGTSARARVVEYSMEQLQQIQDRVSRRVAVGSILAIDVKTNSVEVTVPAGQDVTRTRSFVYDESLQDAVKVIHEGAGVRTYPGEAGPYR